MRKISLLAAMVVMGSASSALACRIDYDTLRCAPPKPPVEHKATASTNYFCRIDYDTLRCIPPKPPAK